MTPSTARPLVNNEVQPVVSFKGLVKDFGPVRANDFVTLDLAPGRIHALLGENGAGKSTLMSVLAGRLAPDAGTLHLDGRAVSFSSPADALAQGIGMVYQRFMLVEPFSVADNVLLGLSAKSRRELGCGCLNDIRTLARRYAMDFDPQRRVRDLSMAERQQAEILKLLARRARILILDEPTAVLAPPEAERLFSALRALRDEGRTIIFISHKLQEVLDLADEITVMRQGAIVAANLDPAGLDAADLARMMVDREVAETVTREPAALGRTVLEVRDLTARRSRHGRSFKDISLSVRQGEIVSVIGVAGNGQGPLAAALGGLKPAAAGTVRFLDRDYRPTHWCLAGLDAAYVPEDRYRTGSVAAMSLTDNYLLAFHKRLGRAGVLKRAQARRETRELIREYAIAAPGPDACAASLSGGNLQKFLLARELKRKPVLFIAEQPTQGLDVHAAKDIWRTLLKARQSMAVLLFTNDLDEALALSDRVAVMFKGRITATLELGENGTRDTKMLLERIGLLMGGAADHAGPVMDYAGAAQAMAAPGSGRP